MSNLVKQLEKKGYKVTCLANRDTVREYLLEQIPSTALVGIGGSMTIQETGIYDALVSRGNEVLWHWKANPTERLELLRKVFTADYFLASTNAITEDGKIVNIDGNGNRVAAMIFGPKKVILVVGKNKICTNLHSAIERIHQEACPPNARRLGLETPCAATGKCIDCDSPQRMCKALTILEAKPTMTDFEVILVDEEMGF